jgi:isoaspartyl peptidase/L-asparaginase-like protein (Ntn-hydrolase superfamily)
VTFMRCGMALADALRAAAEDLHRLPDEFRSEVNIIAVDRDGGHSAVSTAPGKTYIAMSGGDEAIVELERRFVPPADCPSPVDG